MGGKVRRRNKRSEGVRRERRKWKRRRGGMEEDHMKDFTINTFTLRFKGGFISLNPLHLLILQVFDNVSFQYCTTIYTSLTPFRKITKSKECKVACAHYYYMLF